MSITSDTVIPGTCCVCGKPINPLVGALPPLPGVNVGSCSGCGKHACPEHIKQHKKTCSKVNTSGSDWCGTKGIFPGS